MPHFGGYCAQAEDPKVPATYRQLLGTCDCEQANPISFCPGRTTVSVLVLQTVGWGGEGDAKVYLSGTGVGPPHTHVTDACTLSGHV